MASNEKVIQEPSLAAGSEGGNSVGREREAEVLDLESHGTKMTGWVQRCGEANQRNLSRASPNVGAKAVSSHLPVWVCENVQLVARRMSCEWRAWGDSHRPCWC
jgi:hypothetical protein